MGPEGRDGPDEAGEDSPAARLRARAEQVDRGHRFTQRLAEVETARQRARRVRRALLVVAVATGGLVAVVAVVAARAVAGVEPASGITLLVSAVAGGAVVLLSRAVVERIARRRGAQAWDWNRERHVLLGDPSARVRDADRPAGGRSVPPGPGRR